MSRMTDNEVINCLNDTVGKEHIGIYCTDKNGNFTTVIKLTDIVDIINRKNAEIKREHETVEDYEQAAKVIHLYLLDFCDENLPVDKMIAEASRRALAEIEKLQHSKSRLRKK